MIVRAAGPDDAPALDALLDAFRAESGYPARGVEPAVRAAFVAGTAPALRALLAEDDGAAVGFASLWLVHDLGDGPGVWLSDLFVVPGIRRRGVGRALMDEVRRFAAAHGALWIAWHVDRANTAAQAFYAALGAVVRPGHLMMALELRG